MKKKATLILLVLSVFISYSQIIQTDTNDNEYFKVEISQNNKIIKKDKNGIIKLDKQPFKFIITLYKKDGVDVSASWDKYYYDYPTNSNIYECHDKSFFKECRFVAVKTAGQDKFNVDKDLAVGDDGYQWHWSYSEDRDWHRFDNNVEVENGIVHAEMTVENIFDCDLRDSRKAEESQYEYSINKIDKDIYMVFAVRHYESGMEHPTELQREKFVLKFK